MSQYLVAEEVGGLMEEEGAGFRYSNPDLIEADSPEQAKKMYDSKWDCTFFHGVVVDVDFALENNRVIGPLYRQANNREREGPARFECGQRMMRCPSQSGPVECTPEILQDLHDWHGK